MELSKILRSSDQEDQTLLVNKFPLNSHFSVDRWIKKYDNRGKKYWQNMHTKHIQHIKPETETYLIQASIAGNLAFIELYVKSQGDLVITDQ